MQNETAKNEYTTRQLLQEISGHMMDIEDRAFALDCSAPDDIATYAQARGMLEAVRYLRYHLCVIQKNNELV